MVQGLYVCKVTRVCIHSHAVLSSCVCVRPYVESVYEYLQVMHSHGCACLQSVCVHSVFVLEQLYVRVCPCVTPCVTSRNSRGELMCVPDSFCREESEGICEREMEACMPTVQ